MEKKKKNKRTYSKDEVVVILEDVRDKFSVLADGQQVIERSQQTLEKGQQVLSNKIDEINQRLMRVGDDVIEIKHKISEKVDLKDFQKLEKRVIHLEKLMLTKSS